MAIEAKRGCGYRKVGGLYLVADGAGSPCCKMPLRLSVCPCCGEGVKQARGWTWIDAGKMFPAGGCVGDAITKSFCPVVNPALLGRVGLLWVGEKFYPRPVDFLSEAATSGISRRLSKVPREFKAGETWVLFAHPKAIEVPHEVVESEEGGFYVRRPEGTSDAKMIHGDVLRATREEAEKLAREIDLQDPAYAPGVIRISKPRGFERVVKQSEYDAAKLEKIRESEARMAKEEFEPSPLLAKYNADLKRGVTWFPVPDDDRDHQGSAYDKEEAEA